MALGRILGVFVLLDFAFVFEEADCNDNAAVVVRERRALGVEEGQRYIFYSPFRKCIEKRALVFVILNPGRARKKGRLFRFALFGDVEVEILGDLKPAFA